MLIGTQLGQAQRGDPQIDSTGVPPGASPYPPGFPDLPKTKGPAADVPYPSSRQVEEALAQAEPAKRSPAAQLRRSRTAYDDLESQEVRELIEQRFAGYLEGQRRSEPDPAGPVIRYENDSTALVKAEGGERELFFSSAPLRGRDENGTEVPLDLELERVGNGFTPQAAESPLLLPDDLSEPVRIGEAGVEIGFRGGDAKGLRTSSDESVVYPEIARDTDLLLSPEPTGLSFALNLRSPESPESLTVPIELPAGAELREVEEIGGAEVVRRGPGGKAETLSAISPPIALDSDQIEVEVSMAVEGDNLVIDAPHRKERHNYPILVDPSATEPIDSSYGSYWQTYLRNNLYGSGYGSYNLYEYYGSLYVLGTSPAWYAPYSIGQWAFSVPNYNVGTSAYFTGTSTVNGFQFIRGGGEGYWPAATLGMFSPTAQYFRQWRIYGTPTFPSSQALSPEGATDAQQMIFSIISWDQWSYVPSQRWAKIDSYSYSVTDAESPSVGAGQSSFPSSGWVRSGTYSVRPTGSDGGLGINRVEAFLLSSSNADAVPARSASIGCTGAHPSSACPQSRTMTAAEGISFDASALASGVYDLAGRSRDAVYRLSSIDEFASIRIDVSQPPQPAISGGLRPGGLGGHAMQIDATDPHSGVKSVELKVQRPGGSFEDPAPGTLSEAGSSDPGGARPCPNVNAGGCSRTLSFDADKATADYYEDGLYTFKLTVRDQVGNAPTEQTWTTLMRSERPDTQITSGPGAFTNDETPTFEFEGDQENLTFTCKTDAEAPLPCTSPYTTGELGEGPHTFSVYATSAAGTRDLTPATREFVVDKTPPETTITSGPSAVSFDATPTFGFESSKSPSTFRCRFDGEPFEPCSSARTHTPDPPLTAGPHTFEVKATDEAGNEDPTPALRAFTLISGLIDNSEDSMLGLEQFFAYDSTETGLSGAHANLHTGNLVWHSVPMVEPGRGLANVVNVTYNSYERRLGLLPDLDQISTTPSTPGGARDLLDLANGIITEGGQTGGKLAERLPSSNMLPIGYNTAGPGFSAGLSGITRINEPLRVPGGVLPLADPLKAQLTDADGTVHTFNLDEEASNEEGAGDKLVYEQPKGVNLQLRTFANGPTLVGGEDNERTWAITRPEGPTEFYDGWGFLRSIVDRDGNTMRFDYKKVNALTGDPCTIAVTPVLCEPRLERVVDAAGVSGDAPAGERTFNLDYNDYALGGLLDPEGDPTNALDQILAGGALPLPGASDGLLKSITGHPADERPARRLEFAYQFEAGRMARMTLNDGASDGDEKRIWEFSYDEPPSTGADQPQITSISDPKNQETDLEYWSAQPDLAGRQVKSVTNRNDNQRGFSQLSTSSTPRTMDYFDARGNVKQAITDDEGRPTRLLEPEGRITEIDYDADSNVSQVVEASGSPDEATWTYGWGDNGEMTSQTDPIGRTTNVVYCVHDGTEVSAVGSDAGSAFVVDMSSVTRPSGATYSYKLDGGAPGECSAVSKGHVIESLRPATGSPGDNRTASATYTQHGELETETNEAGETTTFGFYEANGLPQEIISPRGNAPNGDPDKHRMLYRYDNRGNVLKVVDPRGSSGIEPTDPIPEARAFTTTLAYDQLDQLISERVPRDTEGSADTFIDSDYDYDRNGNQVRAENGENEATTTEFTAMDRPDTVTNPEQEIVDYGYDEEESLETITSPRGVASQDPGDYTTEYDLDGLGRPLARIQNNTAGPDLITSYAYDDLDRVVGIAMPRDNANAAGQPVSLEAAKARAGNPGFQRVAYLYDDAGQLQLQTENPNGTCASDNQRQITDFEYDDNGNRDLVIHPRADCAVEQGVDPPTAIATYSTRTAYDAIDRPTAITESSGGGARLTRVGYDPVGRVVSEETPRGTATSSVAGDHTTVYDYDRDGNLKSRSVPFADGQYGVSNDVLDDVEVGYGYDQVGNPTTVVDPRGNAITNTFFDSGELKSTNRPSWWRMDWASGSYSSAAPAPAAGRRFGPTQAGVGADLDLPVGGPTIVEGGPTQGTSMGEIPRGGLAGDFGAGEPERLPDFLPRAGETELAYDLAGRLKTVTAQGAGAQTRTIGYDQAGRITEKAWSYGTVSGDPTSITHEFTYDPNGNLLTYRDGVASAGAPQIPNNLASSVTGGLDSGDYTTNFAYDQFDRRVEEDAPGSAGAPTQSGSDLTITRETTGYDYDPNGNVTSIETPRGSTTATGGDFTLAYAYDPLDRLESETNAASESFAYDYDAASNQTEVTDPLGRSTELAYDRFDQLIAVTEAAGTNVERTTTMTLDPEGNATQTVVPGAAFESGGSIVNRVTDVDYDAIGRPWRTTTGSGAPASTNSQRTSIIQRDPSGNVVRSLTAVGADQGLLGQYDPYAAGFPAGSALENATKQATLNKYDADGLKTATFLPHSGNEDDHYQSDFRYDARGRLTSIDHAYDYLDPQARTTRVAYEYFGTDWIRNASDQRDVAPGNGGPIDQEVRYKYDPRGFQTEWQTAGFKQGRDSSRLITRESYPSGAMYQRRGVKVLAAGNEDPSEDSRTYDYFYNPNRSLSAMRDKIPNFAGAPSGFEYLRTTEIGRDAAEREVRINEDWRGGRDTTFAYDAAGNVTQRRTDGQLSSSGGGACAGSGAGCTYGGANAATTTFTYDALDRETTMERSSGGETQGWRTSWWPSDELKSKTRIDGSLMPQNPGQEPIASEDRRFFLPSGDPSARLHDPGSSVGPSTQTYAYDLNGNRTFDERGIHAFNARSQLTSWQRPDTTGAGAPPAGHSYAEEPEPMEARGLTTYTLDGTGQTLERESDLDFKATLKNVPAGQERPPATEHTLERYRYSDGNLSQVVATTTRVTDTTLIPEPQRTTKTRTTSNFAPYDDLGNVREIETETESLTPGDDPPDPELPEDPTAPVPGCAAEVGGWNEADTTYHCYDPFGRLVATQAPKPKPEQGQPDNPNKPTFSFIYDGLDRRDLGLSRQDDGPNATVSERSYVGTSELLSREQKAGVGTETRAYAYDSQGLRIGAQAAGQGGGGPRFDGYERDANGSVIGLEDGSSGEVGSSDTYDYDPYGSLVDPDPGNTETAEEALSTDAADNPFRFEGFYYDSAIQSYDMLARQYRPDVGRFLSQDRFEAAGGDLALQADPLTQNRYAFAGGNPVSNVEFDGHCPGCTQKESQRTSGADVTSSNADHREEAAAREDAYAGGGCYQGFCPSTGGSPIPSSVPGSEPVPSLAPLPDSELAVLDQAQMRLEQHPGYDVSLAGETTDLSENQVNRGLALAEIRCEGCKPVEGCPVCDVAGFVVGDSPLEIASNFIGGPLGRLGAKIGATACAKLCDDAGGAISGIIGGSDEAAGVSTRGETKLYRAVSDRELRDIEANGFRVDPSGRGYQTEKLFTGTADDAARQARDLHGLTGQVSTIVEARFPSGVDILGVPADSMSIFSVPAGSLGSGRLGNVYRNSSPYPYP